MDLLVVGVHGVGIIADQDLRERPLTHAPDVAIATAQQRQAGGEDQGAVRRGDLAGDWDDKQPVRKEPRFGPPVGSQQRASGLRQGVVPNNAGENSLFLGQDRPEEG